MSKAFITYRSIHKEDAEGFWELMNQLDYETKYMMYEPGERKKDLSRVNQVIASVQSGENFLILAFHQEKMVGYLSAERGASRRVRHTAYIVTGICQEYCGLGIGTEFFQRLDVWAKKKGVSRLELTVLDPNTIAKHVYEKSGFVVEGTRKQSMYVDGAYIDEYYMGKIIPSNENKG